MNHLDKADKFPVDRPLADAAPDDVVRGRTLTSWPSLRTDIRNAGGNWVDEEVHNDHGLVTSRRPDDMPAFCVKMVEEFAEGRHPVHRQGATAGAAS
jgi:protease I